MRQVDEAELVWVFRMALRRMSASTRAALASREAAKRTQAEQLLAIELARHGLRRFEVLSDTPLPEGTDLFTAAAYGQGGAGAPKITER
ncbi:MAG: hypothetical protein DI610_05370 [Staphylococcus hominis]|nr:MAG: hypothetical protein DI610_05370 [Staphylococcus hominis]